MSTSRQSESTHTMKHELSCWPLVLSFASGRPQLEDMLGYSINWATWLERGERFALVRTLLDQDTHSHPPGAALARKKWLNSYGDRIRQHMIGMALVVPEGLLEQVQKMQADRLFGVPAKAFSTIEDAFAWLYPLMARELGQPEAKKILEQALERSTEIMVGFAKNDDGEKHAKR